MTYGVFFFRIWFPVGINFHDSFSSRKCSRETDVYGSDVPCRRTAGSLRSPPCGEEGSTWIGVLIGVLCIPPPNPVTPLIVCEARRAAAGEKNQSEIESGHACRVRAVLNSLPLHIPKRTYRTG